MDKVIELAQDLGNAILDTDVYKKMKAAEKAMRDDPTAMAAMQALQTKTEQFARMQSSKLDVDELAMARIKGELQDLGRRAAAVPAIAAAEEASNAFQQMMDNVNTVLSMILNGSPEYVQSAGSCSGNCGSCGGCGGEKKASSIITEE